MSLFAALTVAVGGLNAQSSAIGNISDNLANTQTTGFKGIDTKFESLVTQSNQFTNDPGGVRATPHYANDIQGNLIQSQSATSLAITGQGFFPVRPAVVGADGTSTFSGTTYYTRAGDFTLNKSGYLVNGSGYYLTGYDVNSLGVVDTSSANPIQISDLLDNLVPTSAIEYAANLPSSAVINFVTPPSTIQIYDALGTQHDLSFTWTKTATNNWTLDVIVPDGVQTTYPGTPAVTLASDYTASIPFVFNSATVGSVPAGTIHTIAADASVAAAASATEANGIVFTSRQTGTTGNGMTVSLAAGSSADHYNATIHVDGQTDLVYTDVDGSVSNAAFWTNLAAAINSGAGGVGASQFISAATTGTGAAAPLAGTVYTLAGGTNDSGYSVIDNSAQAENKAQVAFSLNFDGAGAQPITVSFGDIDASKGVTQFGDTTVTVSSFDQNGIPRGSFQSLSIDKSGFVSLNYDNGQNRTISQIPIVQFFAQNQLQRVSGGAFQQTLQSGAARYSAPGANGAGTIVGNSLEGSSVDIATEFTKLIQAQRVYSANARTITTADNMLQEIINVIR